ncbi:hypothetical protein POM88_030073 [Heracleum sosnowskyi]|uniref:Transposase n=1 Tax=Heracleum sosnowskyi TaxID=360622 RepID=A0AAD8HVB1_9APIA|nr:hypothetical protein POM88_030073 [Heracleum sosnowskyi]
MKFIRVVCLFVKLNKWFVWRQPDNVIYATWLKSAALRFTDLRSNARKDWENGKMNNRIGQDVWLSCIENWKTPEFQAKSKIKKSNRKGGVEGDVPYPGTHTSGSVSHRLLATRLGDPPATALFTYAHTRDHDNVTCLDKKSEKLQEKIVNLRAERSQPTDGSLTSDEKCKIQGEMHLAPRTLFVGSGNLVLLLI